MNRMVVALTFWLGTPVVAMAAPFCLNLGSMTPQCIYYDGAACQRDAARQNGSCGLNPNEIRVPPSGTGTYCVISYGGATVCGYADNRQCASVAQRQNAVCSKSEGSPPRQTPDLYAPNVGR